MAISPISSAAASAIRPALPSLPSVPTVPAGGADATGAAGAAGGSNFGKLVSGALDNLQATQAKADRLAVDAATGRLTDVHDYMIAANEASLATELTVALRNRAVEAFNQIMQMGV
jgi:flagellar hook-basal body complex protein FliE